MNGTRIQAFAILACALLASMRAGAMCGDPFEMNAFRRPIDYTDPADQEFVKIWVEPFHFTHSVEALTAGKSSDIPGDLAYTLRQIPNHHRALNSMMRWQLAHGLPPDAEARRIYTMECYFDRAISFRPNDPVLHLLEGIYFHRAKHYDDALKSYRRAEQLDPDNAELMYNIGLVQFDRKDFADARRYADRAYSMGYPMPGLRKKLEEAGQWTSPTATAPAAAPATTAPAATTPGTTTPATTPPAAAAPQTPAAN